MIKRNFQIAMFLAFVVIVTGCSKNYYSGTGKGSSCGCPANPR